MVERLQEAWYNAARAASTSEAAFSMNQPARRRATGTETVRNICSVIVELSRRLGSETCAPTVDRKTTFAGRAASIAALIATALARVSGKPGSGSKSGGVIRKTPSVPEKAFVSASA
jgi:hypothetical protein